MATKEQMERESILAVMKDMGSPVSYLDITQRAGPRLASTLMEMVQEGKVTRLDATGGDPALYWPSASGGTSFEAIAPLLANGHDTVASTITDDDVTRMTQPPSVEQLAAEEGARDLQRMLRTGEATLVDESGAYDAPAGLLLPPVVGKAFREAGARVRSIRMEADRLMVGFEHGGLRTHLYLHETALGGPRRWSLVAAEPDVPEGLWETIQEGLRALQPN